MLSEFKLSKRIAKEKKKLAKHGLKTSRKLEMLYNKRFLLLKNAREGLAREVVETLYDKGVGEIYVGYPKGIAQDKGNERNTNFWSYLAIIKRIKDIAQEYGIKVKLVDEEKPLRSVPCVGKFTKMEE